MTQKPLALVARRLALVLLAAATAFLARSLGHAPGPVPSALAATADKAKGKEKEYDLASLEIFRKVVIHIKDNYVEPKRIDPREMFLQALEAVEKSAAEVQVEGSAKEGRVKVTCGRAVREFEFKDVDSVWMIPHRIRPVFEFLQANLPPAEDRRDVEYSAVNGMLSTLDPHSVLLKPDAYKEMKLTTKGEFGGLGFVISMDEERLTVRKVLKNTPAARAGIKKGDHIARIDDESTINMELGEAVNKLRGKPGTEVRILVKRDKEEEKLHRLVRDMISVESVTSQLLADGVGYARIASFAGTTSRDLAAQVRDLKAKAGGKLKGLVLDLRSNPGGLLDQAHQVADQFVEEGTIVTTSGMSDKLKEPKVARDDGADREFPLVVLVNPESASASEIVAGALKNLDRAAIVGRQSFGKGSVQVLYDLEPGTRHESALKLTIAQYLTPGDKSIQEIGVTPDIELVPARVSKERVDLFAPPRLLREADLERHFSNGFAPDAKKPAEPADKPAESLRYLREEKPRPDEKAPGAKEKDPKEQRREDNNGDDDDAPDEPEEDQVAGDPPVEFARQLLLRAPKTTRLGMLQAARPFLAERRAQEDTRIEKAIGDLGVDWSVSKSRPAGQPAAQVEFKAVPARPAAGEFVTLSVTVANTGKAPFERLRAFTRCTAERTAYQGLCNVAERREFLFGRVAPGERKSWSTRFKAPNHLPAVHEQLHLAFQDAWGDAPVEQPVELEVLDAPRPQFAYALQVLDKDNTVAPGESVEVQVDVKNVGQGRSPNAFVSLRNKENDKVFMKKGRVGLGELKPGETRSALLSLELKPGLDVSQGVPLKLEIGDRDRWEFLNDKVSLPATAAPRTPAEAAGAARVDRDVTLLASPEAAAPPLALARKGGLLPVAGKVGEFLKLEFAKGRYAYLRAADAVVDAKAKGADPRSAPLMQREPPAIALSGIDTARAAVVTDADRFRLSGLASSAAGLKDLRVFVDNEKVFFRTAAGEDPAARKAERLPFAAELPLKPGNNLVLVIAREDDEFSAQRMLVVHRRPAAAVAKEQAK